MVKRVFITGAGFSAPAHLPIQDKIFDLMTKDFSKDFSFWLGDKPEESETFLRSYIAVGLFLLKTYASGDYSSLEQAYEALLSQKNALMIFAKHDYLTDPQLEDSVRNASIAFSNYLAYENRSQMADDVESIFYRSLYSLRIKVYEALNKERVTVNLEDIFTSFDKSISERSFYHGHSFKQMEELRFSIVCLFVYYFSICIRDHKYDNQEYISFFKLLKKFRTKEPTTIITTNWDTLIEEYCKHLSISYDYCLNSAFYMPNKSKHDDNYRIALLKLHGSINWLRCLSCGGLSIYPGVTAANALFNDLEKIACKVCGNKADIDSAALQPEIITPTMVKAFSSQLYSNLWGTASRALQTATEVVFIGYSLPVADFELKYMLQKSIPQTAKIDVVLTHNSNPQKEDNRNHYSFLPEKRYKDAFPHNDICFCYDGFGEYVKKRLE